MKPFSIKKEPTPLTIKSYATTLEKAFENIAKGMFTYIMQEQEIEPVGGYTINLKGKTSEELLVKWISTLQYLHSHHDLVFGYFSVTIDEKQNLTGQIFGQKHTPQLGEELSEIRIIPNSIEITKKNHYTLEARFSE